MIGLIDMNMGNLRSVSNAIFSLGYDFRVLNSVSGFDDVTHLVIPGVGAYGAAMTQLRNMQLIEAIKGFAASGRPIMGICLGMQILSDFGEEGGSNEGLGLVPGKVVRLKRDKGVPIPHVGWNNIELKKAHPIFARIKSGVDFYFVHSFEFSCEQAPDVYACTDYEGVFSSVVGRRNITGFQFHPEKSQANGLRLIENFCEWDGQC